MKIMVWLGLILAFISGGLFGIVSMCCFVVASKEDERMEKLNTEDADSK